VRRLLRPLILVGAALLAAGCAGSVAPDEAATVNGSPILVKDLSGTVAGLRAAQASNQQARVNDGPTATHDVLEQWVRTKLVLDGIRSEGIEIDPKQVDARFAELKRQVEGQGTQTFDQALATQGFTQATVRDQLEVQIGATALTEQLVPGKPDAQLQAELDSRQTEFLRINARHILVADKDLAGRIRTQLTTGTDDARDTAWKTLAAKYSTDTGSKGSGGDLGTLTKGQTVEPFDKALFALAAQGDCKAAKGACLSPVSQPVKTEFGWHVLQVTGVTMPALDDVRDQLEGEALAQRRQTAFNDWLKELAVTSDVRINPRFGSWDGAKAAIATRETAPQAPPTSATIPTIQLGNQDGQTGQDGTAPTEPAAP
jgi:parvulin-like peptidyl-prolyl isomerase